MIRRLVGVLLAALALHSNAARADVACAKHGAEKATPAAHTMDGAHQHQSPTNNRPADKPCETPTQAECCQALVSCSFVAACTDREPGDVSLFDDGCGFAGAMNVPAWLVIPPDPPPPKA